MLFIFFFYFYIYLLYFFFFNDTATTEIYTLSYTTLFRSKAYYVKFETPEDLVSPILEAVRVASTSGKVKKGTNEATKAIERGTSKLIVIAEDVEPPDRKSTRLNSVTQ